MPLAGGVPLTVVLWVTGGLLTVIVSLILYIWYGQVADVSKVSISLTHVTAKVEEVHTCLETRLEQLVRELGLWRAEAAARFASLEANQKILFRLLDVGEEARNNMHNENQRRDQAILARIDKLYEQLAETKSLLALRQ